jgi:ABC-type branched-subunit amino acid transport system ATPase component
MGPILALKRAHLGYRKLANLLGVDIEVAEGSYLGVVGSNGSGKSLQSRRGAQSGGRFSDLGANVCTLPE